MASRSLSAYGIERVGDWELWRTIDVPPQPVTTPSRSLSVIPVSRIETTSGDKSPVRIFPESADAKNDAVTFASRLVTNSPEIGELRIIRDYQYPASMEYGASELVAIVNPPATHNPRITLWSGDGLSDAIQRIADRGDCAQALAIALLRDHPSDSVRGIDIRIDDTDVSKLTYYPASRAIVQTEPLARHAYDMTQSPSRVTAKLVKGLRAIFPVIASQFPDSDWEQLGNQIRAYLNATDTLSVVSGDDIPYWYALHNKSADARFSSCMTKPHGETQAILQLYALNPEVCQMIIATDVDQKLTGRALVWRLTNGQMVLDRIYASDVLTRRIRQYAFEVLQVSAAYPNASGDIQLAQWDLSAYPYLDSFPYLQMADGILTSHEPSGGYRTLTSTVGDWVEHTQTYRAVFTRTVVQTAYVDVDAESEDHAFDLASALSQRHIAYWAVEDVDEADWELSEIETL